MMRRRGFTLIEVMVAVAILAMVTTLTWGTFRETIKTKSAIEAQSSRYRTVRIALERLARDLSMAYLSQNEDTNQAERRTFFVSKHKNDIDEVRFSYFGHQRLYQDANECDTAQVVYYGVRDRNDSRKMNLVRRETRRLSNLRPEEAAGEGDIVCDDVVRLKLDFWDARASGKTWREEWNTVSDQKDVMPAKVRIVLTVRDERGQEIPFQTEVRIAMQEPLFLKAVDQQIANTPPPRLPPP
jgi:general secretion pathway protein J